MESQGVGRVTATGEIKVQKANSAKDTAYQIRSQRRLRKVVSQPYGSMPGAVHLRDLSLNNALLYAEAAH